MLQKQAQDISFAQGLDTKTDPKRVPAGKFLSLENSIFSKQGLLQKRNGYNLLSTLPNVSSSYLTTLNDNLTAIGGTVNAYSPSTQAWVSKGTFVPAQLSTLPLIRNAVTQTQADVAISSTGLICTAYTQTTGNGTYSYMYAVADSVTGQNIISPTVLTTDTTQLGTPKVWVLGNAFVIVYTLTTGGNTNLMYVSLLLSNPALTASGTIATAYSAQTTVSWDAIVLSDALYVAYPFLSGSNTIGIAALPFNSAIVGGSANLLKTFVGFQSLYMSVCCDTTILAPKIYLSWIDTTSDVYNAAFVPSTGVTTGPTIVVTASPNPLVNITSAAQNSVCTIFYEVQVGFTGGPSTVNNYIVKVIVPIPASSFTATFASNSETLISSGPVAGLTVGSFLSDASNSLALPQPTGVTAINGNTITISRFTNAASAPSGDTIDVLAGTVVIMNVGLASKAFIINGQIYFLTAKSSTLQKTYFLVQGSTSTGLSPQIMVKLAYQNGAGYLMTGLPNVVTAGNVIQLPYLFADLVQSVNKGTNPTGQVAAVYSQFGINLAEITLGTPTGLSSAEIADTLHLGAGFLWMYDGYQPVEHNFFLYPEDCEATTTSPGSVQYFYQVTYEWTDNQGNAHKSAPSVPFGAPSGGPLMGTATPANSIVVPYLMLTYKTANPIKISVYRWSNTTQVYYQVTSVFQPVLNNFTQTAPQFNFATIPDTLPDGTVTGVPNVLGNNIIYTNGGVVEDVNAPSSSILTLFDTRLWLVDAEDPNLLWFSKQVIEATPVEMSDLFTVFVPPNVSTVGATGVITALNPMDDKLVIFKGNAMFYINGSGPDNTGANNQYSQPIYITSSVGCSNKNSIVLMPQGLMFQSDKGIWLLGRDMSTNYIGAPVEAFTTGTNVVSAVTVPETNQVRFMLDSGVTLMYDYYYQQWGTFTGIPAISSTLYHSTHTFLNSGGQVFQESPGTYVDGIEPVQLQFTTGWLNMAGLQGYQRAYFFYLLGQYLSPHKLQVSIAYNYNSSIQQQAIIQPNNFSSAVPSPFGDTPAPFGSPTDVEQWRVFLAQERCQAFQISVQEMYDPTLGVAPGAGLTLSGLNIVYGAKKAWRTISNGDSVGGGNNRG